MVAPEIVLALLPRLALLCLPFLSLGLPAQVPVVLLQEKMHEVVFAGRGLRRGFSLGGGVGAKASKVFERWRISV